MEVWRNVTIESSLYCANAYVFWCSLFLLFTWSPLTSDLQKMSQTKKTPSIRRRNEINDTSARRQPTHKTKSEDKSKLLLTTYVFSGLIDVLIANVFILFRAIKESDARM